MCVSFLTLKTLQLKNKTSFFNIDLSSIFKIISAMTPNRMQRVIPIQVGIYWKEENDEHGIISQLHAIIEERQKSLVFGSAACRAGESGNFCRAWQKKWERISICLLRRLVKDSLYTEPLTILSVDPTKSVATRGKKQTFSRNCYNVAALQHRIPDLSCIGLGKKQRRAWYWDGSCYSLL